MAQARAGEAGARARYGIDAPGVVRTFLGIAAACVVVAVLLHALLGGSALARILVSVAILTAFWCLVPAGVMVYGSCSWKLRLRDRWLAELGLRGHEHLLDVGCGRGLMLIGAARRLPDGRAFGVDLWRTVDQSGNDEQVTRANARAEGVEDRIEVHTADMLALPFPDATFDAVVSTWAIHNLPTAADRRAALDEILRVVKPKGRILIADIAHVADYAEHLAARGVADLHVSGPSFLFVIPTRRLLAVPTH